MKNLTLMLCLLFLGGMLSAQDMDNIVPPAPGAAKLAEFTFTPVSLYRGTHNLNVPLHTIDFYGLQIPISISYYSGGVRANEDAGLVGLGWSLNHTGVISRTIMGRDDLYKKNAFGFPSSNLADGYVYDPTLVPTVDPDFNSQAYRDFFWSNAAHNIWVGQKDTEPDVFSLSLFGISTKFVLGKIQNGEVEVIKLSEDSHRIEFNELDQTFTVTTTEGFVAEFDKKARSTNVTGSSHGSNKWTSCSATEINYLGNGGMHNNGRMRNISSWYLSEITSPSGRKINFNYDISADDESEYVSVSAASFGRKSSFITSASGFVVDVSLGDVILTTTYEPTSCTRVLHENFYPISITSTDLKLNVVFNKTTRDDLRKPDLSGNEGYLNVGPNPTQNYIYHSGFNFKDPQRITSIDINSTFSYSGPSPAFSKTITFNQSYFNDNVTSNMDRFKRLKLDGLTINDQTYSFDYIEDQLPDKSTNGIDYWGYYNGGIDNQELVPPYVNPIGTYEDVFDMSFYYQHNNRKAKFDYAKAGMLTKVTYPTGGYTEYDYESNEYRLPEVEYSTTAIAPHYVASAFLGDDDSEVFTFQESNGNDCTFSGSMKITLRYNMFSGNYNGPVLSGDLADASYEVINADNNQVISSGEPWWKLNVSDDPTKYEVTLPLDLPSGNYKVRAKQKTDANGQVLYYANVVVKIPAICDQTNMTNGIVITDQVSGGIRVKRIKNYDSDGSHLGNKKYDYTTEEDGLTVSSGVLMTPLRNINIATPVSGSTSTSFWISSPSMIPHANSAMGGHLGYSEVKEYHEAANTLATKGVTIHSFINRPNDVQNALVANTFESINGSMIGNTIWNSSDEQVLNQANAYINTETRATQALRYSILPASYSSDFGGRIQLSMNYQLKSNFVAMRSSNTTEIRENGNVSTFKEYMYNNDHFLIRESIRDSNNEQLITEYVRPNDLTAAPANSVITGMKAANIISPVIETIQKVNTEVVASSAVTYKEDGSTYLPAKTFSWNRDKGVYTSTLDGTYGIAFEEVMEVVDYDNKGNPIEFVNRSGVHTAIIWGYNQNYPVAQIYNATHAQAIAIVNTSVLNNPASESILKTELNLLRTASSLSDALITTMTYEPMLGISTQSDPNGLTVYYEYDSFGRLIVVRDDDGNIINTYKYNYKTQ